MEVNAASPISGPVVVHAPIAEVTAKAQRVLPDGIGNRVGVVLRVARRGLEGPARVPAQIIEVGSARVNARESEQTRIGDPCIQTILGWVDIGIDGRNGLVE